MDYTPLFISLKVAAIATCITFFLGTLTAYVVTGLKKGKYLLDGLLSLPLVLPPTVTGFILLVLFGKNSPVGRMLAAIHINIIFTLKGAVIAAFVCSFPVMYRTARGAFSQIDGALTDSARTLGADEKKVFFKVALPVAWPGVTAGLVLSFARALGEFGATIMIAGNIPGKTQTMSIAVYTALLGGNRELAIRWVMLIISISFVTLIIMDICTDKCHSTK